MFADKADNTHYHVPTAEFEPATFRLLATCPYTLFESHALFYIDISSGNNFLNYVLLYIIS